MPNKTQCFDPARLFDSFVGGSDDNVTAVHFAAATDRLLRPANKGAFSQEEESNTIEFAAEGMRRY